MTGASLKLDEEERAILEGASGPAMQMAMRLLVRAAAIMRASSLIPASFAHIDSCFYVGRAHLDFAEYLLANGARFRIPAWTNNGVVSLADAGLRPVAEDPEMVEGARRLMEVYAELGCRPVFTCAPYQLPGGPGFGDHIVAAESNAVTYYNAVVGARTNKYGDYLDVACALLGKVPLAGLHLDAERRGELLFDVSSIPDPLRRDGLFYHLLGHHVGRIAGRRIPVIDGLPSSARKHDLKAVSAAVAASGGVEMWHGIGVTPEARDFDEAFGGRKPGESRTVTLDDLRAAHADLSSGRDGPLAMVALGTPHFSLAEFEELVPLVAGRKVKSGLVLYIATSRFVRDLAAARGFVAELERTGATIIVDTCTYFAPAVRGARGRVMTNAAKWAYYAPGMLDVETVFGSLRECAESAIRGDVWRDPNGWGGP